MNVRVALAVLGSALLTFALGVGSLALALRVGIGSSLVRNGPWATSLLIGTQGADPYTRARVAIAGLFALAPSETIYFHADTDQAGEPLRQHCSYRVAGGRLPARWWSITVYGSDHYLIANEANRYSYAVTTLPFDEQQRWSFVVSNERHALPWLPSGPSNSGGRFSLTLRLYNPAQSVSENPAQVTLPSIVREGCR